MYKSRSNIITYVNVLKEKLFKDDYNTLITITDKTKEKHYKEKKIFNFEGKQLNKRK